MTWCSWARAKTSCPASVPRIEKAKKEGLSKKQLLLNIAKIPGVYIPAFYDVTYYEDGRVKAITPNEPGIPARITKAIIKDLNEFAPPTNFRRAHGGCHSGPRQH